MPACDEFQDGGSSRGVLTREKPWSNAAAIRTGTKASRGLDFISCSSIAKPGTASTTFLLPAHRFKHVVNRSAKAAAGRVDETVFEFAEPVKGDVLAVREIPVAGKADKVVPVEKARRKVGHRGVPDR